jgi:hypothetical protein
MQLSTDLPYGSKAVMQHINSGASLAMNVSKEADSVFMAEVKRIDRTRYDRLIKNMQKDAYASLKPKVVRYCGNVSEGRHPLPLGIRTNAHYCDRSCQQAAYRQRVA